MERAWPARFWRFAKTLQVSQLRRPSLLGARMCVSSGPLPCFVESQGQVGYFNCGRPFFGTLFFRSTTGDTNGFPHLTTSRLSPQNGHRKICAAEQAEQGRAGRRRPSKADSGRAAKQASRPSSSSGEERKDGAGRKARPRWLL